MRHQTTFRGANLIVLAVGVALGASGLLAWALNADASQPTTAQMNPSQVPSAAANRLGKYAPIGGVTFVRCGP